MSSTEGDALESLREANARHGTSWALDGRLAGGFQSGAWKLRAADGSVAVLKLAGHREWTAQMLRAERSVAIVRAAGYPTPAWLATGVSASGIGYQIQEAVPGMSEQVIGIEQAQVLVEVLELQADLDPDPARCWSDFLSEELADGMRDLRTTVSESSPAGPALVRACERLVGPSDRDLRLPRTDMVHGDFRPANVLFDAGRISGVIDIEALGSGTRAFDYATLLDHSDMRPDALELLIRAGSDVAGPAVLRACLAHVVLDLVRFMRDAFASKAQLTERTRTLTTRVETVDRLTRMSRTIIR